MAVVYDKAMVYAQYRPATHVPGTQKKLMRYKGPEFPGTLEGTEPPVTLVLHWHPAVRRPIAAQVASAILGTYNITASDLVCVFGCGFNYLGEWLRDNIGCLVCGVDLSQYVQDELANPTSCDDELNEEIQAWVAESLDKYGMEPSQALQDQVFAMFSDPNPRTDTVVVQGDVMANQVRNQIKQVLGNKNPTVVITDNVWQTLTAQEQADYQAALNSWVGQNGQVIHYIAGVVV